VEIPDKGWGVIAIDDIKKGEIICNYNGDLISKKEANEREVMV
jgi:SET domain-containing protein